MYSRTRGADAGWRLAALLLGAAYFWPRLPLTAGSEEVGFVSSAGEQEGSVHASVDTNGAAVLFTDSVQFSSADLAPGTAISDTNADDEYAWRDSVTREVQIDSVEAGEAGDSNQVLGTSTMVPRKSSISTAGQTARKRMKRKSEAQCTQRYSASLIASVDVCLHFFQIGYGNCIYALATRKNGKCIRGMWCC